jgi:putative endonuclease
MTASVDKQYWVYILASRKNGTLYIGFTSDLKKRVWEHKNHLVEGFTQKYGVNRLVHYECFVNRQEAVAREKKLKNWKRAWKIHLLEKNNPAWNDLYPGL